MSTDPLSELRSTITCDEISGFRIAIAARRHWFLAAFLFVWLCGWAFGEVAVAVRMISGRMGEMPMPVALGWLTFWTAAGLFMGFVWLWNLFGRELVIFGDRSLILRRELVRPLRTREFDLALVRNLRYSPPVHDMFDFRKSWSYHLQFMGFGGGSVAFDYGDETVRFGSGLSERESRRLIKTIKERFKIQEDEEESLPVQS